MSNRLFVYGTLRSGQAPSKIAKAVGRLKPVGRGTIRARKHEFQDYPAIKLDVKNGSRIAGEIYQVPNDATLAELDRYEEYDPAAPAKSLFIRRQARVRAENGMNLECWVYEYNRPLPVRDRNARAA
jgi:gamma-glutamylcyclotransferase (GGCT)/AIG2-like uncharacterized protein YtfP